MHFLAYFTLSGTLIKLNIMCKIADHENHVMIYLTTVLCMGEGQKYSIIMDSCHVNITGKINKSLHFNNKYPISGSQ